MKLFVEKRKLSIDLLTNLFINIKLPDTSSPPSD